MSESKVEVDIEAIRARRANDYSLGDGKAAVRMGREVAVDDIDTLLQACDSLRDENVSLTHKLSYKNSAVKFVKNQCDSLKAEVERLNFRVKTLKVDNEQVLYNNMRFQQDAATVRSQAISDCIEKVKEMEGDNKESYEYWKSVASDPKDLGVMKFLAYSGEDSRVIAELEAMKETQAEVEEKTT